ncbi:dihydropteroate synthase [Salinimonas sediminis]|uniref:Dihydropteroate synthase n=1 Tax=Salinimonas sediminis TaxID=2303538 RepID=A0A346NLM4_9ALTE|nr:dihydropteroate synthase [Salinimonas sediminis]AXR06431.1 dihydropteroate synthase [Salinimonas sediminis]
MKFNSKDLDLSTPQVMGILNTTPDSFSDGGQHDCFDSAVRHAAGMVKSGVSFIDVGGESTRPGAPEVSVQQELDRVIPVIEAIQQRFDVVISVDTSKPEVITEAVRAGAALINDVRALQAPGALAAAVSAQVPVCLMHMQGEPKTMQSAPVYQDVVGEVTDFLRRRTNACIDAGIDKGNLIVDPGYGFGKSLAHNYLLLAQLSKIQVLGYPVLVGMSRKSMIGKVLHNEVHERLAGSIALATLAAQAGANIIRVHDVQQTIDAVKIVNQFLAVQQ